MVAGTDGGGGASSPQVRSGGEGGDVAVRRISNPLLHYEAGAALPPHPEREEREKTRERAKEKSVAKAMHAEAAMAVREAEARAAAAEARIQQLEQDAIIGKDDEGEGREQKLEDPIP